MIVEVDAYKEKVPGYTPKRSEEFHRASAGLADTEFTQELKSRKYRRVILMAGGTASGKTEFAHSYLYHPDQLVYDGTLKDYHGFEVKLQRIARHTKGQAKVKVVLIIPRDWTKAFGAFLQRERKMNVATFFDTQIRSKITAAEILERTKTRVEIYSSDTHAGTKDLSYTRVPLERGRKWTARRLRDIATMLSEVAKENGIELIKKP